MESTENGAYEAGIEVARRSTTVYIMGVASTQIYRAHEACIEVVTRSTVVYKVGVAPTEYRAHEACIEVAT